MEICPSCGNETVLSERTGWCAECSGTPVCERCNEEFKYDPSKNRKYCPTCRRTLFLERNADALEVYIGQGFSLIQAVIKVWEDNRAVCLVCKQPIPLKSKAYICQRTEKCKKARMRVWNIRRRRKISLEEALQVVLAEVA